MFGLKKFGMDYMVVFGFNQNGWSTLISENKVVNFQFSESQKCQFASAKIQSIFLGKRRNLVG